MHPKKPLNESPRYRTFIESRDQALEKILNKYLNESDRALDSLKKKALEMASHAILSWKGQPRQAKEIFEYRLNQEIAYAGFEIAHAFRQMRVSVYTLAHRGESEAIGRAMGTSSRHSIPRSKVHERITKETPSGGGIDERVNLSLTRIKHEILESFHLSQLLDEPPSEMLNRIENAFPQKKKVSLPRRILKSKALEADRPDDDDESEIKSLSLGEVDSFAWAQVKQDLSEDHPVTDRYHWELNQEMVHDFVEQVRDGERAAGSDNGITDYLWIAIIDDKTDACCAWRDGLSTTDITDQLNEEHADDDCDAYYPPAHPNCATAGHWIDTSEGKKLIENIRIGDKVLTHKGRFMPVTRTLQSMSDKLLKITLSNGDTLIVTDGHPFLSANGQFMPAKKFITGDDVVRGSDNQNKERANTLSRDCEQSDTEDRDE